MLDCWGTSFRNSEPFSVPFDNFSRISPLFSPFAVNFVVSARFWRVSGKNRALTTKFTANGGKRGEIREKLSNGTENGSVLRKVFPNNTTARDRKTTLTGNPCIGLLYDSLPWMIMIFVLIVRNSFFARDSKYVLSSQYRLCLWDFQARKNVEKFHGSELLLAVIKDTQTEFARFLLFSSFS